MRDLTIVPGPVFAPGCCMVCGGNQGPMLDTGVDIPGDGRMYLCVRTCLRIAADKAGLGVAKSMIYDLEQRGALVGRCTATKKNGERCTGRALPHHSTCVAHTRVKEAV